MTPVQKLSSIFNDKSQFEQEIAMCGFRLSDGLKEDLKDLQGNSEIDQSILRKFKLISSAEHFSKSVELQLNEVEKEINDKVNIVAEANLKSDFLYTSIQKLSQLIEKIEQISQQYPKINLDKLQEKSELFFNTLNIQDDKPSNMRISDDIIEEMVGMGKKMSYVHVTKSILSEFLDEDISDTYMNCLYKATITVTNTIQSIIAENKYILSANFNFSDAVPFLIIPKQVDDSFNVNDSRTKEVIHGIITNMDKHGWEYAFSAEEDYNQFLNLFTIFFEYKKEYKLPETIIKLKRDCKTKFAQALGLIHKELSNENQLSKDKKYFSLIRIFNHFHEKPEKDLYKALTR